MESRRFGYERQFARVDTQADAIEQSHGFVPQEPGSDAHTDVIEQSRGFVPYETGLDTQADVLDQQQQERYRRIEELIQAQSEFAFCMIKPLLSAVHGDYCTFP